MDEKLTIWMEPVTSANDAFKAERETTTHREPNKTSWRGLNMKKFVRQNREIVIRLGLLIAAFLVACLLVRHSTTVRLNREWNERLTEACILTEQETTERLRAEYNVAYHEEQKTQMELEATVIAKMLYPMQYNSDYGLRSACWCVFNRVDSSMYPDTVEAVCSQSSQFMGWDESNPVIQRLYDIALGEVKRWHEGVHSVGPDFLYLEWTAKEITLRTTYEGGRGCHYWYESDWD